MKYQENTILKINIRSEISREYYIKNKYKKRFKFDFKVNNYLIEINPFVTHNSSKSFIERYPVKDMYYHQLKSKIAFEAGLTCIHIFDWDDIDFIIDNILKNETYLEVKLFEEPRKYIYNYKTHNLVQEEGDTTVIIYDDGAVYK